MSNIIQTHAANLVGRDFAIGDLHGSHSCLLNLLHNLNFNHEVDRLFSCGDLNDRGPDSRACLDLLRFPFFFSIKANHELLLLDAVDGYPYLLLRNGGAWATDLLSQLRVGAYLSEDALDFQDVIDLVRQLPVMRTVHLRNGKKVHLIHAELPSNGFTDEQLADPTFVEQLNGPNYESMDGPFLQWGRRLYYKFYRADLSDRSKILRSIQYDARVYRDFKVPAEQTHSPVICGHTPVQRPLTIHDFTNIDTMAFGSYEGDRKWCGLTAVDLNEWRFYTATETTFREVEPLTFTREEILSGDKDDSN